MWHFPEAGIVFCVASDHARLTIVFDLQADPIAGVVCDDADGRGALFAGWMELTRAIERALDTARRSTGADPLPHDPDASSPDAVSR
jgi:predicted metalloprotease